jgi:uncharacterized protein (DUF983 family)
VAERIHQERPASARGGGAPWPCPSCKRSDLSAEARSRRARCTGCGTTYSNIDLAAAVLRLSVHEACLWLARSFGLLADLPWRDVNELPGADVAEMLVGAGYTLLRAPREKLKWACPTGCGSSDAFHTFRVGGRRSRCYSCGATLTNVDLATLLIGGTPADACRWLAAQFGIAHMVSDGPARPTPAALATPGRADHPRDRGALWDELRCAGATLPPTIYAGILALTRLTSRGADYLASRRIPPEGASASGFRSVDGPAEWTRIRKHLGGTYTERELFVAGFPVAKGKVKVPFAGLVPMLLIPFWLEGELVSIRFRTIGPPPGRLLKAIPDWDAKDNRYRSLSGAHAQPPRPLQCGCAPAQRRPLGRR